jgi:hypothetical protein
MTAHTPEVQAALLATSFAFPALPAMTGNSLAADMDDDTATRLNAMPSLKWQVVDHVGSFTFFEVHGPGQAFSGWIDHKRGFVCIAQPGDAANVPQPGAPQR